VDTALAVVDLGEFVVGADQAGPESFDYAEPSLALGDAGNQVSRMSTMHCRCAGSSQ
jgi:hypothetical protein